MGKMFEQTAIKNLVLANRFVRSATYEGMATEDGAVTPQLINKMIRLAKGGVGLIITSHAYVRLGGQGGPRQIGIYKDEFIPGLQKMTKTVHDWGGKIIMQLSHAGRFSLGKTIGQIPLVVSEVPGQAYHEISDEDIQELVTDFADGAGRAKAAGFDGVQIHSLMAVCLASSFRRYLTGG